MLRILRGAMVYCDPPHQLKWGTSTVVSAPHRPDLVPLTISVAVLTFLRAGVAVVAHSGPTGALADPGPSPTTARAAPDVVALANPGNSAPARATPAAAALSVAGQSPAAIGLSWTDATTGTFTNYTLQEASQPSLWAFSTVAVITTAATTTFVVSGISPGEDYDWQVIENYQTCFFFCTPSLEPRIHSISVNLRSPSSTLRPSLP